MDTRREPYSRSLVVSVSAMAIVRNVVVCIPFLSCMVGLVFFDPRDRLLFLENDDERKKE
jgi:hypothetical protein